MNDFPSLLKTSAIVTVLLAQYVQLQNHKIKRNTVFWRHLINPMKGDETQKSDHIGAEPKCVSCTCNACTLLKCRYILILIDVSQSNIAYVCS